MGESGRFPDSHPQRPWWRRTPTAGVYYASIWINGEAWYRVDGGVPQREEGLEAYDAEHPPKATIGNAP